jgi:hypothetical protein
MRRQKLRRARGIRERHCGSGLRPRKGVMGASFPCCVNGGNGVAKGGVCADISELGPGSAMAAAATGGTTRGSSGRGGVVAACGRGAGASLK